MTTQEKYAKITKCEKASGGRVEIIYHAKACQGDEEFTAGGYKSFFEQPGKGWTCPYGDYVKVEYDADNCGNNKCYAFGMEKVTDDNYVQEHCW